MCGRDLRCATSSRRSGDLLLLGRASSTISREVDANGGRTRYRACIADKAAVRRTRRPKRSKLASRLRLSLSEREEISRGLAGGESLRAIAWRDRCEHDEASRAGGLRLGDHGLGTDVGERLSDREPPGVEVDVSPGEAERLSATQARSEQQCPERREWIVGRMGEKPAYIGRGPGPHLSTFGSRRIGRGCNIASRPTDLRADQPARQSHRRQPRNLFLLPLR
jgi:hypothetical protein